MTEPAEPNVTAERRGHNVARRLVIAAILLLSARAEAWDGSSAWYRAADASDPGGAGIFGTGGGHDHGVACLDCHIDRDLTNTIDASATFTPPLTPMAGVFAYVPGQTYGVRVDLIGEFLTPGGVGCGPFLMHTNNFAAEFDDASGAPAGTLASDSGNGCPTPWPSGAAPVPATGTTGLANDCQVIFSRMDLPDGSDQGRTSWSFQWTAPAGGPVTLHYGVVDGNCDMNSDHDAVVMKQQTLVAPSAAGTRARGRPFGIVAAAAAVLVLVLLYRGARTSA